MQRRAAARFRLENSRGPETVREGLAALGAWLADPAQAELRRSLRLWLREGFLQTRLPEVAFPELNDLEEIRILLTERVLDWTLRISDLVLEEASRGDVQAAPLRIEALRGSQAMSRNSL